MTHDRLVYAEQALELQATTQTPPMQQHWKLRAGWSRAEHYVYLPLGSEQYRRLFQSHDRQVYTLHIPTPVTSQ
ncbi:hypothetical protein ACFP81_09575 [Deinococcus lacus]|uniref:Uncharacterized protein n=1 Tax=Deinococcus lacus TaxID=392561 RepID=A0ABW1YGD0_9DEIO